MDDLVLFLVLSSVFLVITYITFQSALYVSRLYFTICRNVIEFQGILSLH